MLDVSLLTFFSFFDSSFSLFSFCSHHPNSMNFRFEGISLIEKNKEKEKGAMSQEDVMGTG